MMEMMKKQMGNASAEPPKPQATGRTEKIGDYQTEIYTWSNSTGMSATLWVAKDFPNYKKINEQLDRLSKSAAGGMGKGMGPDLGTLPGMLVKSEEAVLGQKVTTTLVSAKEAPVDDSVFETPKDYHEMTQPVAGSRKEAQPKAAPKMEQKPDEPAKVRAALVEGTKFPDFDAEDIYRKPLALANYKGKVVLIDFWATWCRPYVTELPRLLRTYEKYHDQGFEIIGINLDQEEGSLTAFIRQNRMTWQQYFDGQVWASKLAVKYGIEDLPANFLLDGEGMIIGKDLLGEALEKALAGALKKK